MRDDVSPEGALVPSNQTRLRRAIGGRSKGGHGKRRNSCARVMRRFIEGHLEKEVLKKALPRVQQHFRRLDGKAMLSEPNGRNACLQPLATSSACSERAEYGFGKHGFKHQIQWVCWPSPSSGRELSESLLANYLCSKANSPSLPMGTIELPFVNYCVALCELVRLFLWPLYSDPNTPPITEGCQQGWGYGMRKWIWKNVSRMIFLRDGRCLEVIIVSSNLQGLLFL